VPPHRSDEAGLDERSLLACKVTFLPGAVISSVMTAFESPVVIVTNIPRDASSETLLALLETFGHLKAFD
jgi:hypothetical protein